MRPSCAVWMRAIGLRKSARGRKQRSPWKTSVKRRRCLRWRCRPAMRAPTTSRSSAFRADASSIPTFPTTSARASICNGPSTPEDARPHSPGRPLRRLTRLDRIGTPRAPISNWKLPAHIGPSSPPVRRSRSSMPRLDASVPISPMSAIN